MTASTTPQVLNPQAQPIPPATDLDADQRRRRRKLIVLLVLLAGLLILLLLFGWYLIFRQPINPIPLVPVSQVPKYSTSIYGVNRPVGIAVSPSGDRIYVTQGATLVDAIVFDSGGKILGKMAPPKIDTADRQLVYDAVDPKTGNVYATDRFTGSILVFSPEGNYLREFQLSTPIAGWQPLALAFDSAGMLYVSDLSPSFHKILVIDRTGNVLRTLGADDRLNFPNGIAVEPSGTIVVADSDNGRLVTYGPDNKGAVRVGRGAGQGSLGLPRGLAIDAQGRIFTVDTSGQHVAIYRESPSGAKTMDFLGVFGDQGQGDGRFNFPSGVAIDARGHVYVADSFNNRVQVWSY